MTRIAPNFKDLTGNTFSRLTVISLAYKNKHKRAYWNCLCACGGTTITCTNVLTSGKSKSCGCLKLELSRLPLGQAAFNRLVKEYKGGAKARGYKYLLTSEQFKQLTSQNCHYCGVEPKHSVNKRAGQHGNYHGDYIYNGIDRKDNNKGYLLENSVTCCFKCNHLKGDMNYKEFIEHINKIYAHIKNFKR